MTKIAIIGACSGLAMALANRLNKEGFDAECTGDPNTYKLKPHPLVDVAAVSMQPRGKGKGDRIRRRQQWSRK